MTQHKTEQAEARTELLATLELLIPAVDGVGASTLELGEAKSAIQNVLVAMQEYLNAELAAEKVVPRKQRPDLHTWLSAETSRLVANTVAAYQVARIEVLQDLSALLLADAVLYGATTVAAELEAEANDSEPETDPFAVPADWKPEPAQADLTRRVLECWRDNQYVIKGGREVTANQLAKDLQTDPALVARLFRLFRMLDDRACKHWVTVHSVPMVAIERLAMQAESKDAQWAAYLDLVGGPESDDSEPDEYRLEAWRESKLGLTGSWQPCGIGYKDADSRAIRRAARKDSKRLSNDNNRELVQFRLTLHDKEVTRWTLDESNGDFESG